MPLLFNQTQKSLRLRFLVPTLGILFGLVLVLIFVFITTEIREHISSIQSKGNSLASYIANVSTDSILLKNSVQLDNYANEALKDPEVVYAVIFSKTNEPLTSFYASLDLSSSLVKKTIQELPPQRELQEVIHKIQESNRVSEVSIPVMSGPIIIGSIKIGLDLTSIYEFAHSNAILILIEFLLGSLLIAGVFFYRFNKEIHFPMRSVINAIQQIARGTRPTLIPGHASGEMQNLIEQFNEMARILDQTTISKDFLDKIFSHMTDILIVTAPDGTLLRANQAAQNLLQIPLQELSEISLQSFFINPESYNYYYQIAQSFNQNTGKEDFLQISPSQKIPVIVSTATLCDDQKRIIGIIWIFQDISERKRLEVERHKIQSQLIHAEKLASIGTLAAGVAHEINNPLTIISGMGNLVRDALENGTIGEKEKKYLEKQSRAIERIIRIVNGLRTYARTDTDHLQSINVHEIIEDTLGLIETIFEKRGITLERSLTAANPKVLGNIGKFQQVIMNLLSNARDAVEGMKEKSKIVIETQEETDALAIRISDNGCGISPENLKNLFVPFFTTKSVDQGTGLGLSISHGIITTMGGTISVQSEVGKGTTFNIRLPKTQREINLSNATAEIPAAPSPSQDSMALNATLLLVDDEKDIRDILKGHLMKLGLFITEAENGVVALELLQKNTFDFVLTDLKMPLLSGEQLLEQALQLPQCIKTKFFIMTGGNITEYSNEQRQLIREKAHGYLTKPFGVSDLKRLFAAT